MFLRRFITLPALCVLAGCAGAPLALYNPITGAQVTVDPQGYSIRRAAVEVAVKSEFDAVLRDIAQGGGPALSAAFDAAAVPVPERAARITQLQGDLSTYRRNPDALISSLVLFGA